MKKTINTFTATLNLIAAFFVIIIIGSLAFENASLPGEYFMNHFYVYIIVLILPFLLFSIPAVLVIFFKKNSTLLLILNLLGVTTIFYDDLLAIWEYL